MKYFKGLILFFSFMVYGAIAWAQSDQPQEGGFGEKALEMMTRTKQEQAIEIGNLFAQKWQSGAFTASQKERIEKIATRMEEKNLRPRPVFQDYFTMLAYAVDSNAVNAAELSNLLNVTEKVLDTYENKEITSFYRQLSTLFRYQAMHHNNYNSLYARGGTFTFDFIENTVPEPAPAQKSPLEEEAGQEEQEDDGWFSDWETEDSGSEDDWGTSWDEQEEEEESVEEDPITTAYALTEIIIPEIQGPVVKFTRTNLGFVTPYDSVTLYETSGSWMPIDNKFVGEGGTFSWENAGLSADSVFAEMDQFVVSPNKVDFSADKVKLTYVGRLSSPVEGVFEWDSNRAYAPENATHPRFKSYDGNIRVEGIAGEDLVYRGGFSMSGPKIYSSSVLESMSSIEHKDKFRALARRFTLGDSLITANKAIITIFHQADSLYHPAVNFSYSIPQKELTVLTSDGGFKNTPFFASYYNMDIYADMIRWQTDLDSLDISILNARNEIPAIFESQEYYNEQRFNRLSGLYGYHPLLMAVSYARKNRSSEFYSDDMAEAFKKDPKTLRNAMVELMQNGYIDYQPQTGYVKIRRKGFHYVMSKGKKKDYDNMIIPSLSPGGPNGTLNLKSQELTVRGIKEFYLSEELDVSIEPNDNQITLLNNRDFVFDGKLNAGNFEYIGKEFLFDYDSFLIALPQIDSIKLNLEREEKDRYSKNMKNRMKNQLVETAGVLYINKPNNKSALKRYPEFPKFSAEKGATVFFSGKEILGGAYDDNLQFQIPPFDLDSINAHDKKAITFEGVFSSGGIFPDFSAQLSVKEDNSLGFVHEVPQEGYPLYEGDARLYGTITLDNNGLRANEKIDHLTATAYSDEFIFYKDSVTAVGSKAIIRPGSLGGASYPAASVQKYEMKWLPQQDSMHITNLEEVPFELYKNTANLYGTATLTSTGMFADGKLLTRGSEARSRKMVFGESSFGARNANFEVKSSDPKKPTITGRDIRLQFDLVNDIATINPEEEGVAAMEFPYARYKTSIPTATWKLDEKKVYMTKPKDVSIENSYFYTTRKDLDSLAFNASGAVYDIETLQLHVSGIPFIKVADAKVTPNEGEMTILQNAELDRLKKATLVIDTLDGYHNLYDGDIKILSRTAFEGSAIYRYVNADADTFSIPFERFDLQEVKDGRRTKLATVSSGDVWERNEFIISPGMVFRGTVKMIANKPALELDGHVKLNLDIPGYDTWIVYKSDAEQQEIRFRYEEAITEKGEPISAGIHIQEGTNQLYSTFVTEKRTPSDEDFFIPSGTLYYDQENDQYKVEEEKKASGESYSGSYLAYNVETSDIQFEGPFNFISGDPNISVVSAGKGSGNMTTSDLSFNTFSVFEWDISSQITDIMAMDMKDVIDRLGLPEAHQDLTGLLYKVSEIIGERSARAYEEKSLEEYVPLLSMGGELQKTISLSTLDLKWSEGNTAWYSEGKIGVSNIGNQDINAMTDGFVEIRKTMEGEQVNIFMQMSNVSWYFFQYEQGRLLMYSSNDQFNNLVNEKTNVDKAKLGEFVFFQGEMSDVLGFINRFRKTYFGIEEPYNLDLPTDPVVDPLATPDDGFGLPAPEEGEEEEEDEGF
ncbi:hypothetical protein AB9P05_08610 [Roseivirga sp. BDSF3-8]|uniref:hypothetical protein n=1 Tax=Roseivirga sp. BDSF3-8 TaxID=3241598 RepID=UPI003532733C